MKFGVPSRARISSSQEMTAMLEKALGTKIASPLEGSASATPMADRLLEIAGFRTTSLLSHWTTGSSDNAFSNRNSQHGGGNHG